MQRVLPYWSLNMATLWDAGVTWWPGFNYTPAEQALMRAQASRVKGRNTLFHFVVATIFIIGLIVIVPGIMFPVLNNLYPDPSKTSGLVAACLLAGIAAISLGLWLPLAMMLSAKLIDLLLGRPADVALSVADETLARRIRWQVQRMALIMSGLLIPGIMAFIIFKIDTQKGPIHYLIQAADVIVFVGTALYLRIAGKRHRKAG